MPDLEEFYYQIFTNEIVRAYMNPINKFINYLLFKVVNLQTKQRAFEVGEKHYDLGALPNYRGSKRLIMFHLRNSLEYFR